MADSVLYDDGKIILDGEGVTLRRYYFPTGTRKRIPYDRINGFSVRRMGWLSGKARLWGSTNPQYWLPLDLNRPKKHTLIVLDLGRFVRPAFSPDNPERVAELLRAHVQAAGATASSGASAG